MRQSKKLLGLGTVLAVALVAIGLGGLVHALHEGDRPSAPAGSAALAAVDAPRGPKRTFDVGETWRYDLDLSSRVVTDASLGGAQSRDSRQELSLAVHGLFDWTVLGVAAEHATLSLRLAEGDVSLVQNGVAAAPTALAATQRALAQGVTVTLGRDGVVRAHGDAPADELAAKVLLQAAGLLQAKMPAAGEAIWDAAEIDGTGAYAARYTAAEASSGTIAFTKDKTGYSRVFAEIGATTTPIGVRAKVDGRYRGALDARDGALVTLEGKEDSSIYFGAMTSAFSTATTTARVTLKDRAKKSASELARVTSSVKEAAKEREAALAQGAGLDDEAIARRQLGTDTLGDVRRQREEAQREPAERRSQASHDAFIKTKAWIKLNERDLSELRRSLEGLPARDDWYLTALNALAFDGCEACQEVLVDEVMRHAGESYDVVALIPYLAEPKQPTVAAEEALRKLAASSDVAVSHSARLALGAMADRLNTFAPARAEAIVKAELQAMAEAATPQSRMTALTVLGNSGSPLLPKALAGLLADRSDDVRATAVLSLRFCKGDDATQAITAGLIDASPKVRAAAIEAMGFQKATQANALALSERLVREESPTLRQALIARLQTAYASVPEAKAAIDRAAEGDQVEAVRVAAKSVILMHSSH